MGLEVGWYLRLSKFRVVEALVRQSALASVEDQLHMSPHWRLEKNEEADLVRVLFTRTLPGDG